MLCKLNKEQEAISILEESLRFRENDFVIKYLAYLYLQQGNANKSLSYLTEVENELSKDKKYLNILAHAYIASGQIDKFRKVLEHLNSEKTVAFQLFPYKLSSGANKLAQQYNSASTEFLKEKNSSVAFLLLNQSLNLEETAFANIRMGQILIANKKFKQSLPYLQKAETMGLKTTALYYNLAVANYYLEDKEEAVSYLNKLKQIDKEFPDSYGLRDKLKFR
jgi:predicted Zn-dependent protease